MDDLHPNYKKTCAIERYLDLMTYQTKIVSPNAMSLIATMYFHNQMKAAMARERNLLCADRVATAHKVILIPI
jgi:hypothetical protein